MKCSHCGDPNKCSTVYCFSCHHLCKEKCMGDCFDVLGIKPDFSIDPEDLENRYLELSKASHPDHCPFADECQRRDVLEVSAAVNQAYRDLRDELARARVLLDKTAADLNYTLKKNDLPQGFLASMLEKQEEVEDIIFSGDPDLDLLERISEEMETAKSKEFRRISKLFFWFRKTIKGDRSALLDEINRRLNTIRYFDRIVERIEKVIDDSDH